MHFGAAEIRGAWPLAKLQNPLRRRTKMCARPSYRAIAALLKLQPYTDAVRASYVECNRIARAARSSFYLAFFGLRKEKHNALCALYAFMRAD